MRQKRSEIFDSYAQLSLEKGYITQEISKSAMNQEDKYADKEWKETIQALYGIEPNGKEDILDLAHPKPVIISPSYDRTNGLVENLKERSNIMKGIALKPNNGNLLKHKYAQTKEDLLKELIQLGFSMDNKDEDQLRKLADNCADRMTKNAFFPFIVPIAAGAVALTAAMIALINHTAPSDQGVNVNCQAAIGELIDLREKLPQIRNHLDRLLEDLRDLQHLSTEYNNLGTIDAGTAQKFIHAASNEKDKFNVVQRYKKACEIMSRRLPNYITLIKSFKEQESRSYDWWQKIKDVSRLLIPTDKEDLTLSLETLQKSLIESVQEANLFMQQAREQEPTLMAVLNKETNQKSTLDSEIDATKPTAQETATVSTEPNHDPNEANDLNKALWNM